MHFSAHVRPRVLRAHRLQLPVDGAKDVRRVVPSVENRDSADVRHDGVLSSAANPDRPVQQAGASGQSGESDEAHPGSEQDHRIRPAETAEQGAEDRHPGAQDRDDGHFVTGDEEQLQTGQEPDGMEQLEDEDHHRAGCHRPHLLSARALL